MNASWVGIHAVAQARHPPRLQSQGQTVWKPVAAPRTGVWEAKRSKELSEVGERGQIPGKPSQLGLKGVGIEVLQPVSTLFDRTQGSG
jgi:hypothetical protein